MEKLQPPSPEPPLEASDPVDEVEEDRAVALLQDLPEDEQQDLQDRASTWLDTMTSLNPHSQEFTAEVSAVGNVARRTFESTASTSSRFMQQSLRRAKGDGSETQETVSTQLADLRTTMDDLAPSEETFASRALSKLPGRNKVKRYFRGYESNQDQLNGVLEALGRGQEGLQRDNAELAVERRNLWDDLHNLQKAAHLLGVLDQQVVRRAEAARAEGSADLAQALENDVLFAVRQRRQDVITQIAVTVQAYLAMGLIEDNNTKLVQGVERARTTTVTALRTAVITAQALDNQKLVLDQIDAVNRTTDDLIGRTSQMLADNTLRVQEQATNSAVSAETLENAFGALFTTLDDIDSFRADANQNFAATIESLEHQVQRAQPYLERMHATDDDEGKALGSATNPLEIESDGQDA